jgi:TolA-binding protein
MDYNLDQSNTTSAINELQEFLNNYPNSEKAKNINDLIDELNYKLEFKADGQGDGTGVSQCPFCHVKGSRNP